MEAVPLSVHSRHTKLVFSNSRPRVDSGRQSKITELEVSVVKSLVSCTLGKVCSDIPGVCIVLQMILVVAISGVLGYLFVTQELLK